MSRLGGKYLLPALVVLAIVALELPLARSADWLGFKKSSAELKAENSQVDPQLGEKASEPVDSGLDEDLVKRAQRPAPELEEKIENFRGQRSPGFGTIELSIQPRNGKYIVDRVDPNGPFANEYKQGDEFSSEPSSPARIPADDSSQH